MRSWFSDYEFERLYPTLYREVKDSGVYRGQFYVYEEKEGMILCRAYTLREILSTLWSFVLQKFRS